MPSFRIIVLALAVAGAACKAPGSGSAAAAAAVTPDTWAVVDGHLITGDDVDKAFRRTDQASASVSNDEKLVAKLSVLDDLVIQEILAGRAQALKIELPESEIDAAFNAAKKNIPDDAFQQELKARNLTVADMRDGLKRQLLSQKVLEREVSAKVAVSDQEVADFFNANKAQFNFAEDAYHIAQIVITPVRDQQVGNRTGDDATTPQEAAGKTQMLMERLKGGAAFADLARDYSEDPQSAPRGGDLGFVPVSALQQAPPLLRDAVFKSQPGTVQVVSQGGAHTIVLTVAKEAKGQRDLATPEVKEGITTTLKTRREQLMRTAYLDAARNDAKIVNYIAKKIVDSQGKLPAASPAKP